jgi:hypothetical protein
MSRSESPLTQAGFLRMYDPLLLDNARFKISIEPEPLMIPIY